jgi:hypothetical protein
MRTSTRIAIALLAGCVIVLVAMLSRPKPISDLQQIQDQLQSAVAGANQHSIGAIMSIVSQDYRDSNGLSAAAVRDALQQAYRSNPDLAVAMSPPVIDITGESATSDSTLSVKDAQTGFNYSRPLHVVWHKEQGYRWLIFPATVWMVRDAEYGVPQSSDGGPPL